MKNLKKKGATFGTVEKGFVLDVLLLILGGDVTAARKSDRSFIGAFD